MGSRLAALVALAAGLLASACARTPPPGPPPPPPVPVKVEPACELAPAAGLGWVVDAKPRAVAEIPDLIPAIALVLPEARFQLFAASHGGIDLRQIKDLCVARYRDSTLAVAEVPVDGEKVAAAFDARSGRPATRTLVTPNPRVLRMAGEVDGVPESLVVLGRDGVIHEQGRGGLARVAEAFALLKLKRATPALKGAALARAAEVLGAAPVRVLAPGPFEGEMANALGGLLRAATAIGAAVKHVGPGPTLEVRIVLTGAWGADASAASERLGAAAHVLSESRMGHLFGLDHPVRAPFVHVEPEALVLDAAIDANALARGLHDVVDAEVADIMR